tara:strand:- start:518 stop:664 length:147 start_codon:yes stop_codon:yes gene_type:complete
MLKVKCGAPSSSSALTAGFSNATRPVSTAHLSGEIKSGALVKRIRRGI